MEESVLCPQFKRCHQGPVRTWNCLLIKWRGCEFHSEYPGSSFFFFFFLAISLFWNSHKCICQSPFENPQLLFCHVWRGMSLKAEKQTGLSLTWIPKVRHLPPPTSDVKTWADLCSLRWSDPFYFIFLRLPGCLSNRGEANAGRLLNYERWARVIPVIQSKEARPKASWERVFCCVVVLRISRWNLQHSGESCQK